MARTSDLNERLIKEAVRRCGLLFARKPVTPEDLSFLSGTTTGDASDAQHGLCPITPGDATRFLNGAATPAFAAVKDSDLSTSDVTGNNVTTAKHGFAPKLPGDATKFLNGTGGYSVPAGSGTAAPSATDVAAIAGRGLWLDASQASSITIGTGVSAWADRSSNGITVSQSTPASQPLKVSAALNGLDVIRFDGVGNSLTKATVGVQLSNGWTLFLVVCPNWTNDTHYRPIIGTTTSNALRVQHEASNDGSGTSTSRNKLETFVSGSGTAYRATPPADTVTGWRVMSALFDKVQAKVLQYVGMQLEGGPTTVGGTVGSSTSDTLRLGVDDSSNFGSFDLAEVIIYTRALTTMERYTVTRYLAAKWGLTSP